MGDESPGGRVISCLNCGFEAAKSSDEWKSVTHIAFGEIPQCPQCDSRTTTALSEQ